MRILMLLVWFNKEFNCSVKEFSLFLFSLILVVVLIDILIKNLGLEDMVL